MDINEIYMIDISVLPITAQSTSWTFFVLVAGALKFSGEMCPRPSRAGSSHSRTYASFPWEWKKSFFLLLLLLLQRWVFTTHQKSSSSSDGLAEMRNFLISFSCSTFFFSLAFAALSIELHVQYFKIDLKIPFSENSSALCFSLADCSIFFRSRTIFPFSLVLFYVVEYACWLPVVWCRLYFPCYAMHALVCVCMCTSDSWWVQLGLSKNRKKVAKPWPKRESFVCFAEKLSASFGPL